MAEQKFNQPYYQIKFVELGDENIGVVSFEGKEEISNLFEYQIVFVTDNPKLDSSKILNKAASFSLIRPDESTTQIHGIISQIEQFGVSRDHIFYKVVLVPRLWKALLTFQNEVYQNIEINELIEKVLKKSDLSGNDFKIDLKSKYPKNEFIVQYRETDFNFLNRRLEHFGIYYYFDHSSDKEVICFTDDNSKLPDVDLSEAIGYNANKDPFGNKESILDLSSKEKVVTGTVQLKDYNYLFPEKQLMAQSQIDSSSPGMYYDYGDNFESEKDAEFLAKVRNQEFKAKSKIFYGATDCRLFRVGYRYKMDRHYRDDWNSEYIITKTTLKGSQKTLFALPIAGREVETVFECLFEAIPFDIDFRPERKTSIPKISGIMSAKLESGSGDEYAFLDDQGRYRFKALFDISDKTNGEASLPIRLTQSYTGSGYGIHFPNHKDTELLWACVDGNVDRPIGLGTIPNPSQATPVSSKNKSQNVIRTASGNEFILDDKSDETQIILKSSDSHKILLDDKDDKIVVTTKYENLIIMDDKNERIEVKTTKGHSILMDDMNKKLEIKTQNGNFILFDDNRDKIRISDKSEENYLTIDLSSKKIVMESLSGDIDILASEGSINIKSKNLTIEAEEDIKLKAGNMKTETEQDFAVQSANIKQEAKSDLKTKGMNVTSEATAEYKIKGLNTTIEAGVNNQVKGSLVTVEASGINTIKGSLVKIN